MTFDLAIISLSDKGVQVALEDGSPAFWLPRNGIEWRGLLEPGEIVSADIPRWLAARHQQLVASRMSTQKVLDLHKVGLDPGKAGKELPMADYPQDAGKGALFKNTKKEKPAHPDYRGECELKGRKFWVSGWIRKSEKTGETYMSLAFRPAEEQAVKPQQQASGPVFDDSTIPF